MLFPVSAAKLQRLLDRMQRLGVRESDFEELFVRGAGPGGQKINKTSSTVLLTHRPSGIQVRCQASRQQALNRYIARVMLLDELESRIAGAASKRNQEIERIRRQKRKRSKRAKDKMLANKAHRSQVKQRRRAPSDGD